MSLHRRITPKQILEWAKSSGELKRRIKNNDLLIASISEVEQVKNLLDQEQIHYNCDGESIIFMTISPTKLDIRNEELRNAYVEAFIKGLEAKILQHKNGKIFKDDPGALIDDIDYCFNTQFMREFKELLSKHDPDLLKEFENSIYELKSII